VAIPNSAGYITIAFIASRLAAPNIGNFSRTASLNGIGRLTADISFSCASDISGKATLSGTPQYSVSSDVRGRATLTANAVIGVTADVNGRANVNVNSTRSTTTSVSGYARLEATLAFNASASISGYARLESSVFRTGSSSISGYALLDATPTFSASASITGYARADATQTRAGVSNISGFARLEATPTFAITSDVIGKANLSSSISIGVTADITGRANLTAAGSSIDNASSQITGTANLSATITRVGVSSLYGLARLDAQPSISISSGINGQATLDASLTRVASADISAIARLDASATSTVNESAQLTGKALLTSTYSRVGSTSLSGFARLDATPAYRLDVFVDGKATLNASITFNATCSLRGVGRVDSSPAFGINAQISGYARLTSDPTYSCIAQITGKATLDATGTVASDTLVTASINGSANLNATNIIEYIRTADISGFATTAVNVTYDGFSTGIQGTANLSVLTWYIQFTIFPLVTIRGTANLNGLITAFTRTSSIQASAQLVSVQTITDPTYLLCNISGCAIIVASVAYACVVNIRGIATLSSININPAVPGISRTASLSCIATLFADYVVPPECLCPDYNNVFNLTCAWEIIPSYTTGIAFEVIDITNGVYEKPPTCMDVYEVPATVTGIYTPDTCNEILYENVMPLINGIEISPYCPESNDSYDLPYTLPVFRWHIMSRELVGNAEYDVVDITNGQFEREQTIAATAIYTETLPRRFKRVGCM